MKMSKITLFAIMTLSFAIVTMSFITSPTGLNNESVKIKPDLKVSKITTVGGLRQGNCNKIRVTIVNSQMVGVKKKIPVILYLTQNGFQPASFVGYLNKGIGPNDNQGQSVWFKDISVGGTSAVTLKAVVNPDQEILESVYNNNTRKTRARVSSKNCKPTNINTNTTKANLTVTVYKNGTWSNGNYTGVDGANVEVKTTSGQLLGSGTTGSNGKVTLQIPKGSCKINVSKGSSCTSYKSYTMPTYNANVNMGSNCN